jgi:hypothetical protein
MVVSYFRKKLRKKLAEAAAEAAANDLVSNFGDRDNNATDDVDNAVVGDDGDYDGQGNGNYGVNVDDDAIIDDDSDDDFVASNDHSDDDDDSNSDDDDDGDWGNCEASDGNVVIYDEIGSCHDKSNRSRSPSISIHGEDYYREQFKLLGMENRLITWIATCRSNSEKNVKQIINKTSTFLAYVEREHKCKRKLRLAIKTAFQYVLVLGSFCDYLMRNGYKPSK